MGYIKLKSHIHYQNVEPTKPHKSVYSSTPNMPQCVTCRQSHQSNSVRSLFLGVPLPCSICLEDVPSENCWSLPCGHSNCKECLRTLGFTDTPTTVPTTPIQIPERIVNNNSTNQTNQINQTNLTEIPPNLRCPQTQNLHRFEFDLATSNYVNDIESYKCIDCNTLRDERHTTYTQTVRLLRTRQENRENNCHHEWRRTGGNYAMDINFYECNLCNGTKSN